METIMACRLVLICLLSLQPSDSLLAEKINHYSGKSLREWPRQAKVDREVYRIADKLEKICNIYSELEAVGWDVRAIRLVEKLKKLGKPALPAIEEIASDRDRNLMLRIIMTERLAFSKEPAVTEPLIELLIDKSEDPKMRWNVADLLGRILKDTTATEALIETMEDKSNPEDVRYSAAHAFVFTYDERAVQSLINAVDTDSSVDVRKIAVAALGAVGRETSNREMIQPLLEIAKDRSDPVRTNAVSALGAMKAEEALPLILEIAQGKQGYDRYVAIWALGNIGGEKAKEVLFDIARNDRDEWVKVDAIKALIDMGDESIIEQIQDAINSVNNPGGKKVLLDKFSKKFSKKK